ncbi:MAG: hypothetical protein ACLGH4_10515, partial [Actinomycetes bacterium]
FVVYEAHEKCKALGRALETELKSMVIQNLRRLRLARFGTPDEVRFRPVPIRAYIDRWRAALRDRELGARDHDPVAPARAVHAAALADEEPAVVARASVDEALVIDAGEEAGARAARVRLERVEARVLVERAPEGMAGVARGREPEHGLEIVRGSVVQDPDAIADAAQ